MKKEQKFEKVVKWKGFYNGFEFWILSIIMGVIVWSTSLIWVPFYWVYRCKETWEENRKVYWRKIGEKEK